MCSVETSPHKCMRQIHPARRRGRLLIVDIYGGFVLGVYSRPPDPNPNPSPMPVISAGMHALLGTPQ